MKIKNIWNRGFIPKHLFGTGVLPNKILIKKLGNMDTLGIHSQKLNAWWPWWPSPQKITTMEVSVFLIWSAAVGYLITFPDLQHMDVSKNSGTPKSSIKKSGFPLFSPSILGYHYFLEHLYQCISFLNDFETWSPIGTTEISTPVRSPEISREQPHGATHTVRGCKFWYLLGTHQPYLNLLFYKTAGICLL